MAPGDEQKVSSIDMWPLLQKFEDGVERVRREQALREAVFGLYYGADVYHVLDKVLKRCALLEAEVRRLKKKAGE